MPCGRAVPSPSYVFDNAPISEMLSTLPGKVRLRHFRRFAVEGLFRFGFSRPDKVDGVILVVEAERTKSRGGSQDPQRAPESAGVNTSRRRFEQKRGNYIPEYLDRFSI